MNIFLKVVFFVVFLILGVFVGQYFMEPLYNWLPVKNGVSYWGSIGSLSLLFGAIFAFYFFLSLLIPVFFNKYKYYLLVINVILLLPTLWLFVSDWWFDGALIALSIIGWLIGEGILRLYKMIKK